MKAPSRIVERFAAWADDNSKARFWGIAKLPDGRVCLLLPSRDPKFRAILICDEDEEVWITAGWARPEEPNAQGHLGHLDDDPYSIIAGAQLWMRELAEEYLDIGDTAFAVDAASVASEIARHMDDMAGQALAAQIIAEAQR